MEIEKFTERARGFLQAAQTIAIREFHQRITPEHLLKALLDDEEGAAAGLIRAAGGDPKAALTAVEAELARQPKVQGGGAGQPQFTPELIRVLDAAQQAATKAGRRVRGAGPTAAGARRRPTPRPAARCAMPASRRRRSTRRSATSARAGRSPARTPKRTSTR